MSKCGHTHDEEKNNKAGRADARCLDDFKARTQPTQAPESPRKMGVERMSSQYSGISIRLQHSSGPANAWHAICTAKLPLRRLPTTSLTVSLRGVPASDDDPDSPSQRRSVSVHTCASGPPRVII